MKSIKPTVIYSLCALLYIATVFSVQAQDIQWDKSYGGQQADILTDVISTPDYGFLIGGSSLSRKSGNKTDVGAGDLDFWIWKMKENGDPEWQKSFGSSGADFLQTIKLTADGGFILAGSSDSATQTNKDYQQGFGKNDFWLVKLDARGNMEWEQRYGGSGQDDLVTLQLTPDGGFIIGGSSDSASTENSTNPNQKSQDNRGNMDYWVLKLDHMGKTIWQKTFGGDYADLLRTITPTADSGFVVGGYSNSPQSGDKTSDSFNNSGDFWILKIKADGTILWQQTIGGDRDDQLSCVVQTQDQGLLFGGNSNSGATGTKNSNNDNGTDFWLYKTDLNGNPLWQKTYNYGEVDILSSMIVNSDQTILLGGCSPAPNRLQKNSNNNNGQDNYIALKISDKGDILWERTVGSKGVDMLRKVIETRDGGYLMAGTATPIVADAGNNSLVAAAEAYGITKGIQQTENQHFAKYRDQAKAAVAREVQAVNNSIKNNLDTATQKTKDYLGLKDDLPIKLTPNANALQLGDLLGNGENKSSSSQPSKPLPRSGDQSSSYGNTDFWVVKLRDRNKPTKEKAMIEAVPNPAFMFTNIIVGFEYTSGTATVVDLAGHTLASFAVTSRTIPIDLGNYPEGIYIVNVDTDKGNESVKVIKNIKK